MLYIDVSEAAARWGISERRVEFLCKTGRIPGVIKDGKKWYLPYHSEKPSDSRYKERPKQEERLLPLPIGVSDFKKAVKEYYYVDKTLLIKELIDMKPQVVLFTRPRRFGKTLNMDMLRTFFEISAEDTSVYFKDKKIWEYGKLYQDYQGKYPVVFLTLKDVKFDNWEDTLEQLKSVIQREFSRHQELGNHQSLDEYEKKFYRNIIAGTGRDVDWMNALSMLTMMLHKVHGKAPIVIIDEYDTPIQEGHLYGFYEKIIRFMRNFFSAGLKDNEHVSFSVMTGILRAAKESMFSGMNNLKVYSVMDERFGSYFGFTETEVRWMAAYYGAEEKFMEVRKWYDGYRFGNTEIYNPWSVINYFADHCVAKAYWTSTGSNEIIGEILGQATPEIMEHLWNLLQGNDVLTYVDTNVIYPEIPNNPFSIYSFLLVAGYLKYVRIQQLEDGNYMTQVAIPNKEISLVYEKEILLRMADRISPSMAIRVKQALYGGDVEKLEIYLNALLMESVSYYDTANEAFYHGMMLGLCAVMNQEYYLKSNRESGLGRFDIQMQPRRNELPGILIEIKDGNQGNLELLADEALKQIEDRCYDEELKANGCRQILKFGIAFSKKQAVVKHKMSLA